MATGADNGEVPDAAMLLRRIHPDQVVRDENKGGPRPSSGAFKDPDMSVDVESILHSLGLDWSFSLQGYPQHSLVKFEAAVARRVGQAVVADPLPENAAHAVVSGKKSGGIVSALRDAAQFVRLADR